MTDAKDTAAADASEAELRAAEALSVQIVGALGERPLERAWRAKAADGQEAALVVVRHTAPKYERERFAAAAERLHALGKLPGLLHVRSLSPSRDAYLTDILPAGTARDLDAFQWPVRRRLEFLKAIAQALESLHKAGIVHGCLCEENILLTEELTPVLAEAGSVSVYDVSERGGDAASYFAFAAPEVSEGEPPDALSDVYALGRLLQHVVRGSDVPQVTAVVRRCAAPAPAGRYASAGAVAAALAAAIDALPAVDAPPPAPPAPPPPAARPPRQATQAAREPVERKREAPGVPGPAAEEATPPPRWAAPAGALMLVVSVAGAFLGAGGISALRVLLSGALAAGAGLLVWAFWPPGRGPAALRVGFPLALAAGVAILDPLDSAFSSAAARAIAHGSPESRRAAIEEIMHNGRNFRGMALAGGDFSGLNLSGADLRDADLSHANLFRANLNSAQVDGTSFEGATLSGADMHMIFGYATHLTSAVCDSQTALPEPWHCRDGHPKDTSLAESAPAAP